MDANSYLNSMIDTIENNKAFPDVDMDIDSTNDLMRYEMLQRSDPLIQILHDASHWCILILGISPSNTEV